MNFKELLTKIVHEWNVEPGFAETLFDIHVDTWHGGDETCELHIYLGLTHEEFSRITLDRTWDWGEYIESLQGDT